MRYIQVLREHKLAIILAILTSIIIALPQVYFRIDQSEVYQGIELLPDSPWSPRVREVQDGHLNWGSIYYKDGKDDPYLFQPFGSAVVAYMGNLFGMDINNTILLSRFVLPFFTFLLIYIFVLFLSRDKLIALSGAAAILLAEPVIYASGIMRLLDGVSPSNFLELARPVNSAMIYIPFFGFLIAFWLFYKKRNWLYGVASAALLGLNFYNYFYTWTYLYAFGGVLVLLFLIQRRWKEAARIAYVFLGALLIAIPYVINLYRATTHPVYEDASVRFGVIASHAPLFVGFMVVAALALFFFGFPKADRERYFFGLALILAPFITMNQQLITGKIMQAGHYHWYFHKPMAVIVVLIVIFHFLARQKWDFYKKALATLVVIASFAVGSFTQADSYLNDGRDGVDVAVERQKYGPVMRWLSENAEKEAVVFGNNEVSHMTVVYTPLNVVYHRAAIYLLSATKERLAEAVFMFYRLRGVGAQDVREIFFKERGYISWNIYGMYYRELLGSYDAIPDEKIEEILTFYEEALRTPTSEWLRQMFAKYEVEYVVWDRVSEPGWHLESYPFLEGVAAFGDLAIYKFVP